jgi:hypothetical protein
MLCLAVLLVPFSTARAQPGPPRIGYVYPAGGRQGTSLQVTVGGQYVTDAKSARISGKGIQAVVLGEIKRPPMEEGGQLRDRLRALMGAERDEAKEKEVAVIQQRLFYTYVMEARRTTPAISDWVLLEIRLDADAQPGPRELRLETPRGVSNRLNFHICTLPEFRELDPELPPEPKDARSPTSEPPRYKTLDVTLPAVVNGQIVAREPNQPSWVPERFTPGDSDRYRFAARKGQRLVIAASARELIPYLPDAVPGWFQATLTLYDVRGKELAYTDDYRFRPDPVLLFSVPEDGQYTVEIKDAIYRGRPDFVYRIAMGELPFVTSVFPLGGRAGEQTSVELTGWNLPASKLTMDAKEKAPGTYPISVSKGNVVSNSMPFAVDTLPERLEKEPNESISAATPITLPVIVNGRIDRPGDWDVFRWEGRAGERVIAEVVARRLDTPLDSVLELTDAAGKRLAINDDHEDRADALKTHYADSLIDFTLPADGTYCLRLGDAQQEGGPEYAYRLRISPPRPDFALRVVPSCINARARQFVPFTVYALRSDGFSGEITLSLKHAPEDFSLTGGTIPAGQDQVRVTLLIPPASLWGPTKLCVEGRGIVGGQEVVHEAVPADDMMQAFAYKHLVPADDLEVAVWDWSRPPPAVIPAKGSESAKAPPTPRRAYQSPITILSDQPLRIPAGGTVELRVAMSVSPGAGPIQVELSDPPEGVAVDNVLANEKGLTVVLRGDAEKAKKGLRGNLIANASQQRTITEKDGRKREYRSVLGTLPAIPFEIVASQRASETR